MDRTVNRRNALVLVAVAGMTVMTVLAWPRAEPARSSAAVATATATHGPTLPTSRSRDERVAASRQFPRSRVPNIDELGDGPAVEASHTSQTRQDRLAARDQEDQRAAEAREHRLRDNIDSLQLAASVADAEGRHAQADLMLTRAEHLEARLLVAE